MPAPNLRHRHGQLRIPVLPNSQRRPAGYRYHRGGGLQDHVVAQVIFGGTRRDIATRTPRSSRVEAHINPIRPRVFRDKRGIKVAGGHPGRRGCNQNAVRVAPEEILTLRIPVKNLRRRRTRICHGRAQRQRPNAGLDRVLEIMIRRNLESESRRIAKSKRRRIIISRRADGYRIRSRRLRNRDGGYIHPIRLEFVILRHVAVRKRNRSGNRNTRRRHVGAVELRVCDKIVVDVIETFLRPAGWRYKTVKRNLYIPASRYHSGKISGIRNGVYRVNSVIHFCRNSTDGHGKGSFLNGERRFRVAGVVALALHKDISRSCVQNIRPRSVGNGRPPRSRRV